MLAWLDLSPRWAFLKKPLSTADFSIPSDPSTSGAGLAKLPSEIPHRPQLREASVVRSSRIAGASSPRQVFSR